MMLGCPAQLHGEQVIEVGGGQGAVPLAGLLSQARRVLVPYAESLSVPDATLMVQNPGSGRRWPEAILPPLSVRSSQPDLSHFGVTARMFSRNTCAL